MLDTKLTQLALKIKNMVVMDLHFPQPLCPEFRKNYETRFLHVPCREGMALEVAAGIASAGKILVLVGASGLSLERLDPTLNVKVLEANSQSSWDHLEEQVRAFGPARLFIPD
ncbi:hypothetical protein IPG41_03615 [Candidatus Peregrinibacteria bacterium]|nr:MAG: hypothetical protein IPG41_03615 [Candidatus Peregrinibacteria bacterium]